MEVYKYIPEGFAEIRKRVFLRLALMLIAVIGFQVVMHTKDSLSSLQNPLNWGLWLFIAFILAFSMMLSLRRNKKVYDSFVLTISGTSISRQILNTDTFSIEFGDIKQIIKNTNGSFTIKGKNPHDIIYILHTIENKEALEVKLNSILPITINTANMRLWWFYKIISLVGVLAAMAIVNVSNNKILVGISGFSLCGYLVWAFFIVQKSKLYDKRLKRLVFIVWIVIISFLFLTITKITGQ